MKTTAPIILCGDTLHIRVSDLSEDTWYHYAFRDIPKNSWIIHFMSHPLICGIHCRLNCGTASLSTLLRTASTLTSFSAKIYNGTRLSQTHLWHHSLEGWWITDVLRGWIQLLHLFTIIYKIREQNIYCFKFYILVHLN